MMIFFFSQLSSVIFSHRNKLLQLQLLRISLFIYVPRNGHDVLNREHLELSIDI